MAWVGIAAQPLVGFGIVVGMSLGLLVTGTLVGTVAGALLGGLDSLLLSRTISSRHKESRDQLMGITSRMGAALQFLRRHIPQAIPPPRARATTGLLRWELVLRVLGQELGVHEARGTTVTIVNEEPRFAVSWWDRAGDPKAHLYHTADIQTLSRQGLHGRGVSASQVPMAQLWRALGRDFDRRAIEPREITLGARLFQVRGLMDQRPVFRSYARDELREHNRLSQGRRQTKT